jgi:hypothetical protein
MHARRRLARLRIGLHHNRVGLARPHLVADVGGEDQVVALAPDRHGPERQILDRDLQLLDRRHQMIAVRVLAQDGREQPHQRLAADGRSLVHPDAVASNDDVDLAAVFGVPQVDRRQAPPGRLFRRLDDRFQSRLLVIHVRHIGP